MFLNRLSLFSRPLNKNNFESITSLFSSDVIAQDLKSFLKEWFDNSATVSVQTSGSTGAPKKMQVLKEKMINSANMTCSFLGLQPGDTALLAMPLKYIGAKMVVVRSLAFNLNLEVVEPSSHPLKGITKPPVFLALTPHQVASTLENEEESYILKSVKHLIIGGGLISQNLKERLIDFPNSVWSTYGMTETLSHIALRKLNGKDASDWYIPFNGIRVFASSSNTLNIEAPLIADSIIETRDIVKINELGHFKVLGRLDNVINSGGIKLQIEAIEEKLSKKIDGQFQITSVPDDKFGEVVVMLTTSKTHYNHNSKEFDTLDRYERPKKIFFVDSLPTTGSGKADRAKAKELAQKLASKK